MITGSMKTVSKAKGFTATLSTLFWDVDVLIEPNTHKSAENHPDHIVCFKNPAGRMMRVGSMWTATSEKTGNTYYSLTLKDRHNNDWRMNAVRNDDMAKGDWTIVPLAGGSTEDAVFDGQFEILDDGNIVGSVGGYDFDFPFTAERIETKANADHPDYRIEATSRSGKQIRMGSIWITSSEQTGTEYLSMRFNDPSGRNFRANAFLDGKPESRTYRIAPLADQKPSLVAA